MSPENYDDSVEPKRTRPIADLYNHTEEVKLDDELLLMGIDEPTSYTHVVKEQNWRSAMQKEIKSIKKMVRGN